MSNYIKSEFYRNINSKSIWILIGIFSMLIVLMNVVLAISNQQIENFPYATTAFSFGMVSADTSSLIFITFIIVSIVFGDENKHNTLKNVVSYGITRKQIILGKIITAIFFSLVCLLIVLLFYISSAYLLLQNSGIAAFHVFLIAILSSLPSCVAVLILIIALFLIIDNSMTASMICFSIIILIPTVFSLVGRKVEIFRQICRWLPYCLLKEVDYSSINNTYSGIWDTPEGLARCIAAGILWSLIFGAFGLIVFKKKELK
ncbi:ABC transporter permease [Anaerosacchariphilus polymeriproducens]|uniref:ABC transporter permease n=1 Tax=Anaerosacchariphilus polymeriproducens TaxID=1812858 RepID=A0A371AQX3_9FIRM|nr:ABC transporter permease [Anaerosacchariphilus polymeriproducens]RDU21976.1 ABC transporter permease [Anaerosacchariphilus polymeriproducens]